MIFNLIFFMMFRETIFNIELITTSVIWSTHIEQIRLDCFKKRLQNGTRADKRHRKDIHN